MLIYLLKKMYVKINVEWWDYVDNNNKAAVFL